MAAPDTDKLFVHKLSPDGIHELCFHSNNSVALKHCFARLDIIFADAPLDKNLLLLTDIRQSGFPSVISLWTLSRQLLEKHPQHPMAYNAILQEKDGKLYDAFAVVMNQIARLYRAQVCFFSQDEYQQAVDWLLEHQGANDDNRARSSQDITSNR